MQPLRALGLFALIAALVLGCTPGRSAGSAAPPEPREAVPGTASAAPAVGGQLAPLAPPVPVRLGIKIGASMSDAGIYIAQDRGYFQEQGLEVEYINFDSGSRMIAPLSADQIDVAAGATSAGLFNAWTRDIPIKVVADKGSQPPGFGYMALVVRKDLIDSGQVRDWADLRGLTIAVVSFGITDHHTVAKALANGGLGPSDARLVEMPFPDQMIGLRNRSLDAALAIEPFITKMVDDGIAVRWRGSDEIYPEQLTAAILYSPTFARTEAALRWMIAYLKGVRDYNDAFQRGRQRDQIIEILTRNIKGIDAATYQRIVPPGLDPNGRFHPGSVAADAQFYFEQGLLKQPIDVSQLIDLSFAERAAAYLGPY